MTTPEEGRELTQIGPGTVVGDPMRRYWDPRGNVVEAGGRISQAAE